MKYLRLRRNNASPDFNRIPTPGSAKHQNGPARQDSVCDKININPEGD